MRLVAVAGVDWSPWIGDKASDIFGDMFFR